MFDVIEYLARNAMVVIYTGLAMLGFGLLVLWYMLRDFRRVEEWFSDALRKVENACPSPGKFTREQIDQLSNDLANGEANTGEQGKNLNHRWVEFTETVHENEYGAGGMYNSKRPQAYFNTDDGGLEPKFLGLGYGSIPTFFVTIGLIFTFISLGAVLYYTSIKLNEINPDDGKIRFVIKSSSLEDNSLLELEPIGDKYQEEIKKTMINALNLASTKFFISICGLAASLLLSFFYKRTYNRLAGKINKFNQELEGRLIFARQRELEQIYWMQRMSYGIDKMADTLAEVLRETIMEVFEEVKEAMHLMAATVTELRKEMHEIVAGLSKFKTELDGAIISMRHSIMGAGDSFEDAVKRIVAALEQSVGEVIASMDRSSSVFAKQLHAAQSAFAKHTKKYIDISEEYTTKHDLILKESNGNLEQSLNSMKKAVQEASQMLLECLEKGRKSLVDYNRTFDSDFQKLFGKMTDLINVVSSTSQKSSEEIEHARKEIAELLAGLRNAVDEMKQKADKLADVFEAIERMPDKLSNLMKDMSDSAVTKSLVDKKEEVDVTKDAQKELRVEIINTTQELKKLTKIIDDINNRNDNDEDPPDNRRGRS